MNYVKSLSISVQTGLCVYRTLVLHQGRLAELTVSRKKSKQSKQQRLSCVDILLHVSFMPLSTLAHSRLHIFTARRTLTSSPLIIIPHLPSFVFLLFLFIYPTIACIVLSLDVIIWAFVFV